MHPLIRRLSRTLASATALTLLATPAVAVAAPVLDGNAGGRVPTSVTRAEMPAVVDDPPLEASTPTIVGAVQVGKTAKAHAGAWTSGTTFTYQWFADGEPISGATGFAFTPTVAQHAKRLTVRLDGSREGYAPVSRTSGRTSFVSRGHISQPRPAIVGSATPGATLTASRPPAVPTPDSVTYRWRLDGESIRGATRSTLTMRSEWKGHEITVSTTVKEPGYLDATLTSPAARVGAAYTKSPTPVISGTKRVGSTLTVTRGTWSPSPSSFSFQWYADGRAIAGATASKYTLRGTDYKKEITVTARTYRAGYGTVLRRSAATAEVLASAVRWKDDGKDESFYVGADERGVVATTYIAQAGTGECTWGRQGSAGTELGRDTGSGQRMFTILPTDHAVWTNEACGIWIKYYSGMVKASDSTATDGNYVLGDHLNRGDYSTTGPADAGTPCTYALYEGFYGESGVISSGEVTEPTTITLPDTAYGFATAGCAWQRIN
ncbi:hypothetical protein [Promicromonospora sukumoe]|uniref:hypothetical protein n=1 Tax=Promicromonospora sukumoe TaxID=88382 RepID=UPI00036F4640|nr:hypothetical protein [Promicromonospora sukumoe]